MGISPVTPLLAEELVRRAPASIGKALFTSSGTESVEAAIKLGRAATKRQRVVCVEHAFHGLTLGSLSVKRRGRVHRSASGRTCRASRACRSTTSRHSRGSSRREDVALFVVEPILGKGVILPEDGYLAGAQELCRRYGTLFCLDEVQTGLGRTGKLFAAEHWGLEPDLMPVAKSLSGATSGRRAADGRCGLRRGVRLARARLLARLDLRAERLRDGLRGWRHCASWTTATSSEPPRAWASCCWSRRGRLWSATRSSRTCAGLA
jgi:hypothetical protein